MQNGHTLNTAPSSKEFVTQVSSIGDQLLRVDHVYINRLLIDS